jgi:hypothetical protein
MIIDSCSTFTVALCVCVCCVHVLIGSLQFVGFDPVARLCAEAPGARQGSRPARNLLAAPRGGTWGGTNTQIKHAH